jgi:hypothetical protein
MGSQSLVVAWRFNARLNSLNFVSRFSRSFASKSQCLHTCICTSNSGLVARRLGLRSLSQSKDINKLTVKELSSQLREKGLRTTGKKQELIDRLAAQDIKSDSEKQVTGDDADALRYEKKSPVEHVLLRPDSYVGSMKPTVRRLAILNLEDQSLQYRDVTFIPALLKIFDEILVNAVDNLQRDSSMKHLDVVVDPARGLVSVRNDGRCGPSIRRDTSTPSSSSLSQKREALANVLPLPPPSLSSACLHARRGIPVVLHPKHDVYVPELIMGRSLRPPHAALPRAVSREGMVERRPSPTKTSRHGCEERTQRSHIPPHPPPSSPLPPARPPSLAHPPVCPRSQPKSARRRREEVHRARECLCARASA